MVVDGGWRGARRASLCFMIYFIIILLLTTYRMVHDVPYLRYNNNNFLVLLACDLFVAYVSRLPPPPARAKPALLFSNIEEKERESRKHLGSVAKNTLFFARERARVQIDSLLKNFSTDGVFLLWSVEHDYYCPNLAQRIDNFQNVSPLTIIQEIISTVLSTSSK